MPPVCGPLTRLALVVALLVAARAHGAAPPVSPGEPLAEAIAAFAARGLSVIYSDDLVTSDMRVRSAPVATDELEALREILRPHGLALAPGPRGAWLVVRAPTAEETAISVRGRVTDAATGEPVSGARVRVLGRAQEAVTDARGEFVVPLPPSGTYEIAVAAPGFAPAAPATVATTGGEPPALALRLQRTPPPIETIVISASYYALDRSAAEPATHLSRTQIENAPTLGDDALRATHGLPGVASTSVSARASLRGGDLDETLIRLDGMRLYNPYHFRDFESPFSGIDPAIVSGIEVRTGGYPATFGDRMSGVIDVHSVAPSKELAHELSVSVANSAVFSSGQFESGAGGWVASLRRSNLDLIVQAVAPDIGEPEYFDLFAKVDHALGERWKMSGNALVLVDSITLTDDDVGAASADYDDGYYWLRLEQTGGGPFSGSYLLSHTRLRDSHDGFLTDEELVAGELAESREVKINAFAADWQYRFSDRQLVRWGAEVRDGRAEYTHDAHAAFPHPIVFDGAPRERIDSAFDTLAEGYQHALYASVRTRFGERVTTELGARWDRQTYTDESELGPRANVRVELAPRTQLRIAAGRFNQAQGIEELQISDGVDQFFPAQRADHLVLGIEHRFDSGLRLQVEGYRKTFDDLRPRFENLYTRLDLLPELRPDRVRIAPSDAESSGIEASLQQRWDRWEWWANAAWSSVEDRIGGRTVPRSWDQPWSVGAGAVRTGARWTLALAGTYHTGWPSTTLRLVDDQLVAGELNGERVEEFLSVDMRASRRFELPRSDVVVFAEVTNALDHSNPCCLEYQLEQTEAGDLALSVERDTYLPLLPSVGVSWRF
jgi:outer membrane receptor protein involved in Fe transport